MPQPVDVSGAKPHRQLLQRPELAAHIAAIAAQWTSVEERMAELLSAAFGHSTKDDLGAHSISRNWVALTAIRETETNRVRLKIIDATLGAILKDRAADLFAEWEEIRDELNKRGRERNKVVHGNWSLSDEYPDDLILETPRGARFRYTLKDFQDILDRIVIAWQQCYAFQLRILDAKLDGIHIPGSTSPRT